MLSASPQFRSRSVEIAARVRAGNDNASVCRVYVEAMDRRSSVMAQQWRCPACQLLTRADRGFACHLNTQLTSPHAALHLAVALSGSSGPHPRSSKLAAKDTPHESLFLSNPHPTLPQFPPIKSASAKDNKPRYPSARSSLFHQLLKAFSVRPFTSFLC
jgi:hypothetical protein